MIKLLLTSFLCVVVLIISLNIKRIAKIPSFCFLNKSFHLGIILTLILLVPTYFLNYNLSDEAYYHSLLIFGKKIISFSSISIYLHKLGQLFSHEIIGYRLTSLILIYLSALILYLELISYAKISYVDLKKKLIIIFLLLTSFYPIYGLITVSYNIIVVTGSFLIIASLIALFNGKNIKFILFYTIGLVLVFLARPPAVILLLGIIFITTLYLKKKFLIPQIVTYVSFLLITLLLVYFNHDYYLDVFSYYVYLSESSHSSLISNYLFATFLDLIYATPLFLFLSIITRKHGSIVTKPENHFYLLIYFLFTFLVFSSLVLLNKGTISFKYVVYSLISLNINFLFTEKGLRSEHKILLVLCILIPLSANFSTNGNLVLHSGSMMLIYCIPLILVLSRTDLRLKSIIAFGSVISLFLITQTFNIFYLNPYMSDVDFSKKHKWDKPPLSFLIVDKKISKRGSEAKSILNQMDFKFDNDRIFAYPNIPGYSSILQIEPYGNSWNFAGYNQIHLVNCYHINKETLTDGEVFLILEEELPDQLESCLFNKLLITEKTEEREVYLEDKIVKFIGPLTQI
jgi:hypothetical protein